MIAKFFSFILLTSYLLRGFTPLHASSLQTPSSCKVKVVVFDFGGVIAKTDHQEINQFIATSLHISLEEAQAAKILLKQDTAQGKEESDFWKLFAISRGIQLPDHWMEKLSDAKFRALKVVPGMIEIVKDLQQQGFQTALLSNVIKSQAQIKSKLGYYELFNPTLFSYEIGVSKPDPKAFHILLDRLKTDSSSILFIDNKLPNVKAAQEQGMDSILFTNTDQLIQDLKQRCIEIHSHDSSKKPK